VSGSPFSLEGKRILVTGASSGIGAATARLCARMGAGVIACGRDAQRLGQVVEALAGSGHAAIAGDLTDAADRQVLIDAVPVLDGVVFSAGIASLVPVRMVSQRHLDAVFAINFNAPILLTQALLAKRKIAQGGSLVYVTSAAQHWAFSGSAIYAGTKAALTAAVRTIAAEHAKQGIRANCVSPGYVATPMLDGLQSTMSMTGAKEQAALGTIEADDVAGGIAYLLAPASRWVSRASLVIDAGLSLHVR
jgi:NAD(P)-dependent dehydrogenase (short-subunit alcohol dehydrogenase family)